MPRIERQIKVWLVAAGIWGCATACGPTVVDLGARGGGHGPNAGADGPAETSGTGGVSGAAELSPSGGRGAGSNAVAIGGAGSDAGLADAGATSLPDAAVADLRPDPSRGCGMQPPASDTNITFKGSSANYIVDPPSGYDRNTPYPLLFSFRGANTTAAVFRRALDLATAVGANGIVVNVDCADGAATWDLQIDPPVFDALLAKLEASYCIDQRRVFLVGHETGAIFASVLACQHGGVLRGLGSLNGVAPMQMCTGALAVWISQGATDMTRSLGRASRDFWVGQNRCDATMTKPVEQCLEYLGCEPRYPVRYCEYNGGVDVPSFAASAVWGFFRGL